MSADHGVCGVCGSGITVDAGEIVARDDEALAARVRELEVEQDNAGFIPWAAAQDALDEYAARVGRLERVAELTERWLEARRTYPERAKANPTLVASGDFMRENEMLEQAVRDALAALNHPGRDEG